MKRLAVGAALALTACGEGSFSSAPPATAADGAAAALAPSDLPAFFDGLRVSGHAVVSAHRGGPRPGYAENTIEAFAATLAEAPVFIEVDVRRTRDGALVLMHDETVDRTTTGSGAVRDLALAEVQALALVDADGGRAEGAVPTLRQALDWAHGRTVLELDIKPGVAYEDVVREVEAADAMRRVIFIGASIGGAGRLARLAPDAMISTSIESASDLVTLERRGADLSHILAWLGDDELSPSLVRALAERDMESRFGVFGRDLRFAEAVANGISSVSVDAPEAAVQMLDEADGMDGYAALTCLGAWRGADGSLWINEG